MLAHPAELAYASDTEIVEKERVIQIGVLIDWTPERIKREIRETFPEAPDRALAIAKCESQLDPGVQSHHILSYGREESYGLFQVHARDWEKVAEKLKLTNWKTDPGENIKLARYIYDQAGKRFTPWTCNRLI